MPLTGPQFRAQLADRARNTSRTVKGGGETVDVQLIFDNKAFLPEDLFDALEVKYGSGKVTSDLDNTGMRQFRFRIVP